MQGYGYAIKHKMPKSWQNTDIKCLKKQMEGFFDQDMFELLWVGD